MPANSNRLIQFWKELKRRKVISVIPVYAVAAFVILQVADMVREPLHLPPWTMSLLIIILSVGFIVAVILAWAYDISPKGIDKTGSVEEVVEQKGDQLFIR